MKLDFFIGSAAESLVGSPDQTTLKVFLSEKSPEVSGSVVLDEKVTATVENLAQGASTKRTFVATHCPTAEWLLEGSGTDRPDIVVSEKVLVVAPQGTTNYKWVSLENSSYKRQVEHWTKYLKASSEEGDTEHTDLNSYKVSLSSLPGEQGFEFKTTKNNGEQIVFECSVNLAEGKYYVADDKGNLIHVNAVDNVMTLEVPGSTTTLSKEAVYVSTPQFVVDAPLSQFNGEVVVSQSVTASVSVSAPVGTFSTGATLAGASFSAGGVISATDMTVSGTVIGPNGAILHKP